MLVLELTKKVRKMTKMVQVLERKLQSYEEKEFNDQIFPGDNAFNEACMQIDLSTPINSNVPTYFYQQHLHHSSVSQLLLSYFTTNSSFSNIWNFTYSSKFNETSYSYVIFIELSSQL